MSDPTTAPTITGSYLQRQTAKIWKLKWRVVFWFRFLTAFGWSFMDVIEWWRIREPETGKIDQQSNAGYNIKLQHSFSHYVLWSFSLSFLVLSYSITVLFLVAMLWPVTYTPRAWARYIHIIPRSFRLLHQVSVNVLCSDWPHQRSASSSSIAANLKIPWLIIDTGLLVFQLRCLCQPNLSCSCSGAWAGIFQEGGRTQKSSFCIQYIY